MLRKPLYLWFLTFSIAPAFPLYVTLDMAVNPSIIFHEVNYLVDLTETKTADVAKNFALIPSLGISIFSDTTTNLLLGFGINFNYLNHVINSQADIAGVETDYTTTFAPYVKGQVLGGRKVQLFDKETIFYLLIGYQLFITQTEVYIPKNTKELNTVGMLFLGLGLNVRMTKHWLLYSESTIGITGDYIFYSPDNNLFNLLRTSTSILNPGIGIRYAF